MLASELIEYIIENNKIEDVLTSLGCHHINSQSQLEYRCALPNHNNKTSVSVKKETLKIRIYSEDETVYGDIFTLTMHIKGISFPKAVKYMHEVLGLKYTKYKKNDKEDEKENKNPLNVFLKVKPKKINKIDVSDIKFEDCTNINDFLPYLYIGWYKEGILPITRKVFNIRFDEKTNRIAIPHYNPEIPDKIMGIMGRSILSADLCDALNIPKYYPLVKFPKSLSLYGYTQNYKDIIESGVVFTLESEKSVLKLHSKQIRNAVAIGSHSLSDYQIKLLIGLNVEIVICYDQDIKEDYVISECKRISNIRKCSYMFDRWNLLNAKESPADKDLKIFNFMFKYRTKI